MLFRYTMLVHTITGLVYLPIIITLLHSLPVNSLELPDYEPLSFSNPNRNTEFTRLAIYNDTGSIFIGGGDTLHRLAADFTREESVNTAVDCGEENCPINYNKILLVDYGGKMLVTCGSESSRESDPFRKGTCQTRALDNIAVPVRDDDTTVVASGKLSTEAIIAPGPENGGVNTLYVAATYEEERYDVQVFPVVRRTFSASTSTDNIFNVERDARVLLARGNYPDTPFLINYVLGFVKEHEENSTHYTYFVTSQRQDFISREDRNYFSKINRVCQDGDNGFNSYAEILLDCQGSTPNDKYNLVQAAHVGPAGANLAASLGINAGEDVFYGVFAKNQGTDGSIPSTQSALCIFKLEDIEDKFIDAILGCLNDRYDGLSYYALAYLQGSDCPQYGNINRDQAKGQQCSAANWALADGIDPLVSTAVIEWSDTLPSSIITATHKDHTIAFVGTTEGSLVKVHIESGTRGREYERFSIGSPALRDAVVDEAQEMVTLLTEQTLFKFRVENCNKYTTCDECIGGNAGDDGDPYCGWCTLEKKCTRHDSCPMADVSTRWLPYNSAQCVSISDVAPYLNQPITLPSRQIKLTVEQLPDLTDGYFYECIFDDTSSSRADKVGNTLECNTPMQSEIPPIPSDSDHVTMQLHVYSTETNVKFVDRDYHLYECNTHDMCVACTNSSWACDWCIYSNKCTHDNSTCSEDDQSSIIRGINNPNSGPNQGLENCPQLAAQDEKVLVSVGVKRPIIVSILNLPDDDKVKTYECILHVEGEEQRTGATKTSNDIVCTENMYTYNEIVHMIDVRMSVMCMWNGNRMFDDIHGFDVTLYKCEVGRPDCSRCLANLTTMPELGCGWCKGDDICSVVDSSDCSGDWIPSDTNTNCPNPMLTGVSPPSGLFEGNTIIAVSGTDIGQKFSDIVSVTVGGDLCSQEGLEDHYIAGSSVSCRTMPGDIDAKADIIVTVMGSDGNPQESTGEAVFTYRDPSISSFEPSEGPADGGTMVNIEGMYLDAGYEITAMIGSECVVERNTLTETSAKCRTGSGTVLNSHTLVMSFDGANRESEDMFTYQPNPQVFDVQPRSSIQSGGRIVKITGSNLGLAQEPEMIIYADSGNFTNICEVMNDTMMTCKTPNTTPRYEEIKEVATRKKRQVGNEPVKQNFGFLIGDVQSLRDWSENNNVTLDYFADPKYETFKANPETYNGSILILLGRNLDYASSEEDVQVYVGPAEAHVQSLDENTLTCKIPDTNPGAGDFRGNDTEQGLPIVYVVHGNLEVRIGRLQYPKAALLSLPIIVLSSLCGGIVLLVSTVLIYYSRKFRNVLREKENLLDRLRNLQQQIKDIEALGQGNQTAQSVVLPNNVTINPVDVRITYDQLTIGESLGEGAFGKVFEATLESPDNLKSSRVAVKTIKDSSDPSKTIQFLEEGLIMKDFNHENVLGLIGLTFDLQSNPLVIIPLMKNGDLKSFMKKARMDIKNSPIQLLSFALDGAMGMEYLSGENFVHRDLAARNCMVDENLVVKIADFGLSRDMNESDYYRSRDVKAKLPVKWMAPESLDRKIYTEKTDVWSFGVLLWEIFSLGARPYMGIANRDMYYYIEQGNRLSCPTGCNQEMYKVMMDCWEKDPKRRPSFSEIVHSITTHKAIQENAAPSTALASNPHEANNESENLVVQQSYLDMTNPRDSYLQPMTTTDGNESIQMDTTQSDMEEVEISHDISNKNLCREDNLPTDYVNEAVIKFRVGSSFT